MGVAAVEHIVRLSVHNEQTANGHPNIQWNIFPALFDVVGIA